MATTITITGQGPIRQSIQKLSGKITNPKPIFTVISKKLVDYFKDNMEREGAKLTQRWRQLSPQTIAAKTRLGFGGKKILERTGTLKKGMKEISMSKSELVVGNDVDYYKFHQLGGKKIPHRQMVGVNSDIEKIVIDEFKNQISF